MLASIVKSRPRNLLIVRALAGDSTITSDLPLRMGAFSWPCLRSVRNWGGKTGIANKLNLPVDALVPELCRHRPAQFEQSLDPVLPAPGRRPSPPPPAATPQSVKIRAAGEANYTARSAHAVSATRPFFALTTH